jgi:hypothetical protein
MFSSQDSLAKVDPELWSAIQDENKRQEDHIELIASENYVSHAVMEAQGSQLTNKYAEGYPGKRYYGGCEHVDVAEQLAIDRLKTLFGAEAANVQPNSGSQANQAVLMAFAKPGDTIMGMSLAEGGHLTHGMPLNMSGKWFNVVAYGLDAKEEIDYDADGSAGPRAQAEDHHRRRLRLRAAHRLRALRQGRQGSRRDLLGRHGALRRPHRRRLLPQPGAARRRRHLDHPQDPARPARRHHPDEGRAREGAQLRDLPRPAGRPADARHRRQGGGLQGGGLARIPQLPGTGDRQRPRDGKRAVRKSAACASSPAAPNRTSSWSTCATRRSPARPPKRCWAAPTSR